MRNDRAPERAKEKAQRGYLKRDPEFCGFLAKELDMEKAPESYHKALREIYAELPRDMPVRHYPLRAAMKNLAVTAAVLVVLGLSLLGANQAYPQLTESLPGVGMLFKTLNGTEDAPNLPPVTNTLVVHKGGPKGLHKIPDFAPIQVEDENGLGKIQIQEAWCDGENVYLDVSLWVSEKLPEKAALAEDDLIEARFQESGEDAGELSLRYDGTSRYEGVWKLQVPESGQVGESVFLQLNLGHGYLYMADGSTVNLPLTMPFSLVVEVDKGNAVTLEGPGEDNEYTVESLRYTPGAVTALVTVPRLGYYGYSLLPGISYFGGAAESTPYGLYAVVSGEDGEALWEGALTAGEPQADGLSYQPAALSAVLPPADREKLTLSFYQFDPQDLRRWAKDAGLSQKDIVNPVTAAFTLDLAAGTLEPVEDSLHRVSRLEIFEMYPPFESSQQLYVRGLEPEWEAAGSSWALTELVIGNYTYTEHPAAWVLRGYKDGQVVQTATGCDLKELEHSVDWDYEGVPIHRDGSGELWLEDGSEYELNTFLHVYFQIQYPPGMQGPFDRLELVDTATGEVLIEDLEASYERNLRWVLTAGGYKR